MTIPQNNIKRFFAIYEQKSFKKGTTILSPNDPIRYIYHIEKGEVRQYAVSQEGEEATLHIFHPGSYFPIMLTLSQKENAYFFEALTDTVIRIAPTSDVTTFLHKNPDVLFDLTVRFAKAIEGLLEKTMSLLLEHAYQKVISILLYLSKHEARKKKGSAIELLFSHEDIAGWIGVERETVSRQIEKLQKIGLVTTKKHSVLIHNIAKLRDELSRKRSDLYHGTIANRSV